MYMLFYFSIKLELRTGGCRLHKSICICCVTFVFSELFPYLVCVLFHLFLDFDLYIVVTSTNKSIIIIIIFSVIRYIVDD